MRKLQLFSLALLGVTAACADSTSPSSHSALTVKQPSTALQGNTPPPPVGAAITIEVFSTPVSGAFTGTYFSNGSVVESQTAATEIADPSLSFTGTAWLRLDKTQLYGSSASANARFQVTDQKLFGRGTIIILNDTIQIDSVTSFVASPTCNAPGQVCAQISFDATVNHVPGHKGFAQAYDREFCQPTQTPPFIGGDVIPPTEGQFIPGSSSFTCSSPGITPTP